jgi:hypothetical protein
MQRKLFGITSVDLEATGQLLIIHSAFVEYLRKKGKTTKLCIFFKNYNSVRREVLYNIFIEFGILLKPVRLINLCLNKTYGIVWVGRHLSDMFLFSDSLK